MFFSVKNFQKLNTISTEEIHNLEIRKSFMTLLEPHWLNTYYSIKPFAWIISFAWPNNSMRMMIINSILQLKELPSRELSKPSGSHREWLSPMSSPA